MEGAAAEGGRTNLQSQRECGGRDCESEAAGESVGRRAGSGTAVGGQRGRGKEEEGGTGWRGHGYQRADQANPSEIQYLDRT